MEPTDLRMTLRDQRDYYAARAGEYDDAYRRTGKHDRGPEANASYRIELATLIAAFKKLPLRGDIVELAAGTGFWTERLVSRARSLHVIDASPEMLTINRQRLGAAAEHVSYQVTDLFEWHPPPMWDACVFGFWICKVPDELIAGFLNKVAASLRHTGVVCFIDKAAASEPATEYEERTLNDGRMFTIIDHPRPPERLVELFATVGLQVEVETIGDRFCVGHGIRS
jgi:SAM-dependent methyltransferase